MYASSSFVTFWQSHLQAQILQWPRHCYSRLVFVFDFIAFVAALVAEQMRSTATAVCDMEFNYNYCVYSSSISTNLGIIAFVLLLVSQVLTLGASQGFCSGKPMNPRGRGTCAIFISVICWITFFMAEACLLVGSIKNAQRTKYRTIFSDDIFCQTLSKGVFEAGAAFILIASLFSKINYICCSNSEGDIETDNSVSSELGIYTSLS